MRYVLMSSAITLGLVFGMSFFSKARAATAQRRFATSLRSLVPTGMNVPIAAAVTAAEAAAAIAQGWAVIVALTDAPRGRTVAIGGSALTGLLCVILTAGVATAMWRRTGTTCACFGVTERALGARHLVRTITLGVVAVGNLVAAVADAGASTPTAPLTPAGAALGVGGGVLAALILVRLDDLVDLFGPATAAGPNLTSGS